MEQVQTTCMSAFQALRMSWSMISGELRMMPFVSGLSVYGSINAAPQDPSAPD